MMGDVVVLMAKEGEVWSASELTALVRVSWYVCPSVLSPEHVALKGCNLKAICEVLGDKKYDVLPEIPEGVFSEEAVLHMKRNNPLACAARA